MLPSGFDEMGKLDLVLLRRPQQAYVDVEHIERQWRALHYPAPPGLQKANEEYDRFVELLGHAGTRIEYLPGHSDIGLDAIYVRDASVVTPAGMVLCAMGKPARSGEPGVLETAYTQLGIPIAGRITAPGKLEGGTSFGLARPPWQWGKVIEPTRGH